MRIGERAQLASGPPWILGHRGAPLEAPENTLASLRRAVELGLDGFAYDLRMCATGELVLLADETLQRTTSAHGPLAHKTLPELSGVDAGGWFARAFTGEPLPLFEEALEIEGNQAGTWPQHHALLREPGLVQPLARALETHGRRLSVRVASPRRADCLEARDLGLEAMLVTARAGPEEEAFVKGERIAATAAPPGAWRAAAGAWPSERWALAVDEPAELLDACRVPLNGFHTREPLRALAVRALARLAADPASPYPIAVPELLVAPDVRLLGEGEWCGRWELAARVTNPFGFPVRAAVDVVVRRGTFEAVGLPVAAGLEPGASIDVPFRLTGGSWRPGGDPVVFVHYVWERGPGRAQERLSLDAPLHRVRELHLGEGTRRLPLLRERPGDSEASLTVRRRGRELLVAIENPGGLADARLLVHLDGALQRGGAGMRLRLPPDSARRPGGIAFSAGFSGRAPGSDPPQWRVRRWAGGIPETLASGRPGRLLLEGKA